MDKEDHMNHDRTNHLKMLNIRWQKARIAYPVFEDLGTRLLAMGGDELVITPLEDQWAARAKESEILLEQGECLEGKSAILVPGEPSECGMNTLRLVSKGEIASLVCGWALSDGLWRDHFWGVSHDAKIVETTEVRSLYFGRVWPRDRAAAEFWMHLEPRRKKRRTPVHKAVQLEFDFEGPDDKTPRKK
jgi:hypothetical protein